MEDTRVGCPGIVLEGKGMVGRGWGCTWSQVRRSPLKHLVFVRRPWGAVVQMLVKERQEDRRGLEARESQKFPCAGRGGAGASEPGQGRPRQEEVS